MTKNKTSPNWATNLSFPEIYNAPTKNIYAGVSALLDRAYTRNYTAQRTFIPNKTYRASFRTASSHIYELSYYTLRFW